MYTAREVTSPLMREKFFPEKSVIDSLYLAVVWDGNVVRRETLVEGTDATQPGDARLHVAADGRLYAFMYVDGKNVLMPIGPEIGEAIDVPLERPLRAFATASRARAAPSNIIDVLGQLGNTMVYAWVDIRE